MMLPDEHLYVIKKILALIGDRAIIWALTGSTSMALQGMPMEAHDIDIQTDKAGAYDLDRLLAAYTVTPVRYLPSERIHSHFGSFEIDGVEVEVMGDMEKRQDDGSWEAPVNIEPLRRWVEAQGMRIPVIALEHEVEAYAKMGRVEKAEKIRAWLESKEG